MFGELSIRIKIFALVVFIGLSVTGVVGFFVHRSLTKTLQVSSFNTLTAIRETKRRQVESIFKRMVDQIQTLAEDDSLLKAAAEFKASFRTLATDLKTTPEQMADYKKSLQEFYRNDFLKKLNANVETERTIEQFMPIEDNAICAQYLYIVKNPNPSGSKWNLNTAHDASSYTKIHEKYHPFFRNFTKRFNFHDLFLIDPENGRVLYTVAKEVDFAASLVTGPQSRTNLAQLFRQIAASTVRDKITFIDYEQYDPSYAAPAAFAGISLYEGDKKVGVLVLQVPIEEVNRVMSDDQRWEEVGFGKTGEAYLVAHNHTMRSVARLFVQDRPKYVSLLENRGIEKRLIDKLSIYQTTILLQRIATKPVKEMLKGDSGAMENEDYLGNQVLSAYAPLTVAGLKWGIIVQMNRNEAFGPAQEVQRIVLWWGIGALIILLLVGYLVLSRLLSPLGVIISYFERSSAQSGIDIRYGPHAVSEDEFGKVGTLIDGLLARIREVMDKITERWRVMTPLLTRVVSTADVVNASSRELIDRVQTITQSVEEFTQVMESFDTARTRVEQAVEVVRTTIHGVRVDHGGGVRLAKQIADFTTAIQRLGHEVTTMMSIERDAGQEAGKIAAKMVKMAEQSKSDWAAGAQHVQELKERTKMVYEASRLLSTVAGSMKNIANRSNALAISAQVLTRSVSSTHEGTVSLARHVHEPLEKIVDLIGRVRMTLKEASPGAATKELERYSSDIVTLAQKIEVVATSSAVWDASTADPGKSFIAIADELKAIAQETERVVSQAEAQFEDLKINANNGFRTARDTESTFDTLAKTHEAKAALVDTMNKVTMDRITRVSQLLESMHELSGIGAQVQTAVEQVMQHHEKITYGVDQVVLHNEAARTAMSEVVSSTGAADKQVIAITHHVHETDVVFVKVVEELKRIHGAAQEIKKVMEELDKLLATFI